MQLALPQAIGRVVILPAWFWSVVATVFLTGTSTLFLIVSPRPSLPYVNVAMIGNSMQYYNDFPRFMEELSDGHITQNSCLHGGASLESILLKGNGMGSIWMKGSARIFSYHKARIYDYGACTVKQLLFGYDADLESRIQEAQSYDDDANFQKQYGDDFFSYDDGTNPCLHDENYYHYLAYFYFPSANLTWNYILMNDNTRSPARSETRQESLDVLQNTYLPWFLETGATPIFLATYGYWTPYRDMGGLVSVSEFTSLTFAGYEAYVDMLSEHLPAHQQPRIAPVGLAFLFVYEQNRPLWERLFHVDQVHCGPLGTYLQGLVVHHTIFGVLPRSDVAVRGDMSSLWLTARGFQPNEHTRDFFPSIEEASYLYQIAVRVCIHKQVPRTFTKYINGEAVDYEPNDDLYRMDDLF